MRAHRFGTERNRRGGARTGTVAVAALAGGLAIVGPERTVAAGALPSADPPERWIEKRWTMEEGLPQSSVLDVAESGDGNLWLATFGGLVRFDGAEIFTFDSSNVAGFPSDQVTALEPIEGGDLWVVTAKAGAFRWSRGRIVAIRPSAGPDAESVDLVLDRSGRLWIRDSDGALRRWGGEGWIEVLAGGPSATHGSLIEDATGTIWASAGNRLHRIEPDRPTPDSWNAGVPIRTLALGRSEEAPILLGLADGLARWTRDGIHRLVIHPELEAGVSAVSASDPEQLIVATTDGRAWTLRRQPDGRWRREGPWIDLAGSDRVRTLSVDAAGTVWAGTDRHGLIRLRRAPVRLHPLDGRAGPANAVVQDDRGGFWAAFGCAGLGFARDASSAFASVVLPEPGSGSDCVHSLLVDSTGRVWIGRGNEVLTAVPGSRGPDLRIAFGVAVGPMAEDAGGIWVALRGGRLVRLGGSDGIDRSVDLGAPIETLVVAPDGALWAGAEASLFRVSEAGVRRWGPADGVRAGAVRDLVFAEDGSLWIASYGGGLGSLVAGRFQWITREHELPDHRVTRIVEDESDRFWLLTNRGAVVVSRGDLDAVRAGRAGRIRTVLLGRDVGMVEGNFGRPAGLIDRDGRVWFATIEGVASIDARRFPFRTREPAARWEWLEADGRRRPIDDVVVLPRSTERIRIRFAVADLDSPSGPAARYRLRGRDSEWSTVTSDRVAEYPGLPPGEYRFELQPLRSDGSPGAASISLELTITPKWWPSTPTRVVLVLLALGALGTTHLARVRVARRRLEARLRESETRRVADARVARARAEVEHLQRVATAGQLSAAVAHDLKQPLAAIVANAAAAQKLLASGPEKEREVLTILDDISSLGRRGSRIVDGVRRLMRKEEPIHSLLDVNEVVNDSILLVRGELERRSIELSIRLDPAAGPAAADRTQLQQVLVNLLTNAADALATVHGKRQVFVSTISVGGSTRVEVRDNGPGLPQDVRARLFEPLVTSKSDGMGMGLAICREVIESSGGAIQHHRPSDGGALFRIELPSVARAPVDADSDRAKR